jgi:hypothetical protein
MQTSVHHGPFWTCGATTCGPCVMRPPNAIAIANTKPTTTAITIVHFIIDTPQAVFPVTLIALVGGLVTSTMS